MYNFYIQNMENISPRTYYQEYQNDSTMKDDAEACTLKQFARFTDNKDIILMSLGTILSLASGVTLILYAIPFGNLVNAFAFQQQIDFANHPQQSERIVQKIVDQVLNAVFLFLGNSAIVFLVSWFMSAAWTITSQRQMIRARQSYFASLMRQQIAWHDRNRPAQVCAKMYIQIGKVHQGLVNNVTSVLTKISMGLSGIIIALIQGWQMALVMIAFLPVMLIAGLASSFFLKKIQKYQQKTKSRIDSEVIEVFDNVKTVRMLDGQQYETERYHKKLEKSKEENTKNGIKNKLAFAFFFFCILMNYALGFWYGAKLISQQTINTTTGEPYAVRSVIIIFFTLYMSNLSLSGLPQSITNFNFSRISMTRILNMVDRQSRIKDGESEAPKNISKIKFDKVLFQYENPLFEDFDLTLKPGLTALIGESGSGKTTIINLLMRFYDIFSGQILFESEGKCYDLKKIKFESLTERIGYVGQQPVLIGKTLREALTAEDKGDQKIIEILKAVRAWNFVKDIGLDNEYSMLSGGQKQRIAIARALIKNPQILILDQGTSALDRKTEQQVLNSIKKLRIPFVIMIAHRMQTVIASDNIIKLQKGKIAAYGKYQQLVEQGIMQQISIQKKDEEENHVEQEKGMTTKQQKQKEEIIKMIDHQRGEEDKNSEDEEDEKQEKQFHMSYICKLMKMNKNLWYLYLIGIIGSFFIGAIFPTFAYLLSNMIVTLLGVSLSTDAATLLVHQQNVQALSLSLFLISVGSLIIVSLRGVSFTNLTETLGLYLKQTAFKNSINKSMIEIDNYGKQNLANIITTNCEDLKHLGGHHIGDMIENTTTVLVGLAIAFAFSWQVTLITLGVFPLIILSGKLQMSFQHGMQSNTDKVHKKTHESVIQSVMYIKTVKSLNLQARILNKYTEGLDQALSMAVKYGNLSGIMFGLGQCLISCLLALIFYIGALLIKEQVVGVLDLYTAIFAVMFAGVQAGGNLYFLTRLAAAKYAACNYFQTIENSSSNLEHSVYISNNRVMTEDLRSNKKINGTIELHDVQFKYESRDTPIFKNFSLAIKSGEKVALVGESGSGKSTITNILFKIYEPVSGEIFIDGKNINLYDIGYLRRQFGIVQQEPVLFNRSVYENIKYNSSTATFQDVVKASKMANAFDFVCQGNFGMKKNENEEESEDDEIVGQSQENLISKAKQSSDIVLEGFKKKVGTRGSYLSGGQKQRIAIARALIRKPSVIVLDEATSALDNQNQKIVQQAIQSISNATQIVIAHRLSTVENCDKIVVMKQGNIIEQGKYNQLLKRRGYFYNLVNAVKQEEPSAKQIKLKEK